VCCIDRLNSPAKAVVRKWLLLAELGPMATAEFSQPVTGGASCHARRYYL